MSDINLLPQEYKPKGYALKLSVALKKFEIIAVSLFIVVLVLVVGFNIFLSIQSRNIENKTDKLKAEIKAFEQTEQKLVLVADRVNKIKAIENSDNAFEETDQLKNLIQGLPQEITINGIVVEKNRASLTVKALDSASLTKFFAHIKSTNANYVEISSFIYEQKDGYEVEISFSGKEVTATL